ncbi:MAG: dethiobiotin synthase [Gammaproteobacteria bacterium]|nr:MAG: dethiobiotin synthase [Gammaproteobacteria bacterium]
MRILFVTGTDTGVGKTWVTLGLIQALQAAGRRVAAVKPVAAGTVCRDGHRVNEDAWRLGRALLPPRPPEMVAVEVFDPPIAPHIAAERAGRVLDPEALARACRARGAGADWLLVEGAGGWRVPLARTGPTLAEVARCLRASVLLVVGLRLGCLNHALLTAEAVAADGLALAGWVGVCLLPDLPAQAAQVDTLRARLTAPCLGVVPHLASPDPARLAAALDPTLL